MTSRNEAAAKISAANKGMIRPPGSYAYTSPIIVDVSREITNAIYPNAETKKARGTICRNDKTTTLCSNPTIARHTYVGGPGHRDEPRCPGSKYADQALQGLFLSIKTRLSDNRLKPFDEFAKILLGIRAFRERRDDSLLRHEVLIEV